MAMCADVMRRAAEKGSMSISLSSDSAMLLRVMDAKSSMMTWHNCEGDGDDGDGDDGERDNDDGDDENIILLPALIISILTRIRAALAAIESCIASRIPANTCGSKYTA